ncbi:MAG: sodium:glutamate symporter [Microbacteriaceae bacterium]|nr:sodium:glutamate symporter [Microbacteriaceae bacterium]
MFGSWGDAQWIAFAFVFLGIALIAGLLVRRALPFLGRLYIPASVIAGFLIVLVGPQALGAWTGGRVELLPGPVAVVLSHLPGLLINVVFAGIMLGKRLPSLRTIWGTAEPHVLMGGIYAFGQMALGAFAVVLILTPFFGLPEAAGSIMEASFAGGHGTIAGIGGLFTAVGAPELIDVGLALATISIVTGTVIGFVLVNWAIRSPKVDVARKHTDQVSKASRLSEIAPNLGDTAGDVGLGAISRAFGAICISLLLGLLLLWGLRELTHAFGAELFDDFPLFPFALVGGFLVQLALSLLRREELVSRRTVNDISGLSLDLLIAAAIGTLSLAAVGAHIWSIVILTAISVAWSVIGLLWLGPRLFATHWFDRAIPNFGQSQGNVATGFILADMSDPDRRTGAAVGFGYRQLFLAPVVGGGVLTAFSVPVIQAIGSLWFGVIAAVLAALLAWWGIRRARRRA